jgi:hypothetical protein
MMWGATSISSEAGYAGVGPNFLPWVVAVFLAVCSAWLIWESMSGGYRNMPEASGAEKADWHAFAWVSAGILANAALINVAGFVVSCAHLFYFGCKGSSNFTRRSCWQHFTNTERLCFGLPHCSTCFLAVHQVLGHQFAQLNRHLLALSPS